MRVLVTGAGGQLGMEVLKNAPKDFELVGLKHDALDIGDAAAVDKVVDHHRPNVIVNAAAYNAVDDAEKQSELAYRVNASGPGNLARAGLQVGARIIHISTDYVFDGRSDKPYQPTDATNPINTYGKSKLAGEQAVAGATADHLIIRTSWLFSARGRNFLQIILTALRDGKTVRAVKDQVSVPTACRGLAEVIWLCAKPDGPRGVAHWVDRGQASRYDQAVAIREMALTLGLITGANPIEKALSSQFKSAAVRPRFTALDASGLSRQLGHEQRHWKDWLVGVLEEIYLNQTVTPRGGD